MNRFGKIMFFLFVFVVLTIVTQIGGIVLCLALLVHRKYNRKFLWLPVFILFYALSTFLIVPFLAKFSGREKITETKNLKATNWVYTWCNRNYVTADLHKVLTDVSEEVAQYGIVINYLDANFPFVDRFPLLPHLSHSDGKKIDLSLVYQDENGNVSDNVKSRSGYGIFEEPVGSEMNQTERCKTAGYFQYDYPKYLSFGEAHPELSFSAKSTKRLLLAILSTSEIEKIFIEPHLQSRLGLKHDKIRFHGCGAVRHDDHIHIQVK